MFKGDVNFSVPFLSFVFERKISTQRKKEFPLRFFSAFPAYSALKSLFCVSAGKYFVISCLQFLWVFSI